MPAERINVSFEPRPLELLYSKYAPNKGVASSSSSTPFTQPNPSSLIKSSKGGGKKISRSEIPVGVGIARRQELGDLRKLGRELTKMERVQMFFDMSNNVRKGKTKSRSQPNSADVNVKCLNSTCHQCSQALKQEDGQTTKLRDLKSKLRLVAGRTQATDSTMKQPADRSTSPARDTSQHVVPLPMLHLNYRRHVSSSEDLAASRDAKQSLRYMFYPQHSVSRRAAVVRNYQFTDKDKYPSRREFLTEHFRDKLMDSIDSPRTQFVPPAMVPTCSPADDIFETKTTSTFDADRMDSEQFEYVFERFSAVSSSDSWDSMLSAESDTATYSARAQRPSTTDTVTTLQRCASMAPPMSPISPRQRVRDGESWPPQYTVVPSWPSLDDPYRFQYFGCGLHRDIKRRLHKSRSKRRNGKHGRPGGNESEKQQPAEPQKLEVVVPYYTECSMCNFFDCEHVGSPNPTIMPSTGTSVTAKSAKSRDSLSMSVCTVLSRQTRPSLLNGAMPIARFKDKTGMSIPVDTPDHGKGMVTLTRDKMTGHKYDFNRNQQSTQRL